MKPLEDAVKIKDTMGQPRLEFTESSKVTKLCCVDISNKTLVVAKNIDSTKWAPNEIQIEEEQILIDDYENEETCLNQTFSKQCETESLVCSDIIESQPLFDNSQVEMLNAPDLYADPKQSFTELMDFVKSPSLFLDKNAITNILNQLNSQKESENSVSSCKSLPLEKETIEIKNLVNNENYIPSPDYIPCSQDSATANFNSEKRQESDVLVAESNVVQEDFIQFLRKEQSVDELIQMQINQADAINVLLKDIHESG